LANFMKKHPLLTAAVIVILILVLVAVTTSSSQASAGENLIGTIFDPLNRLAVSVTTSVRNWVGNLFGSTDLHEENRLLKEQVVELEGTVASMRELQLENERLKSIANYFEQNPEYEMITARISAKNPGYWFDNFIISAGRNQGIKVDMPVVSPQGLVGRVSEVGGNWSRVASIIDSRSSVSGLIERTRDACVVRGAVQEEESAICSIHYLSSDNDLVPGDMVLTSGMGGIFPKGLVVGEITEVSRVQESSERTATLSPAVDFTQLEEVMVILQVFEKVEA
jgi:rod shape-determining protein MreC